MTQTAREGNWLSNEDQIMFLAHRYARQEAVIQVIWLYRRPVSMENIEQFYTNLSKGLLGRRIERCLLPIGRHHWVSVQTAEAAFEMSQTLLPANQLHPWADAQIELPLDPEFGPAWRLAAQSFDDGSTCISLTISHCIADGVFATLSVIDAVKGVQRDFGYPQLRRRPSWRSFTDDIKILIGDIPLGIKALSAISQLLPEPPYRAIDKIKTISTLRLPWRRATVGSSPIAQSKTCFAPLVSVTLSLEPSHWDQKARELRADRLTLLVALAGHLGVVLGRAKGGNLSFVIPVSVHASSDNLSANQVRLARFRIPVSLLSDDLPQVRRLLKNQLLRIRRAPDSLSALLPLSPFLPPFIVPLLLKSSLKFATDFPITCSHQGVLPTQVKQIDGGTSDGFWYRGLDRCVSYENMRRRGGLLTAFSSEVGTTMIITIVSFQVGAENNRSRLISLVNDTLEAFQLTATIL